MLRWRKRLTIQESGYSEAKDRQWLALNRDTIHLFTSGNSADRWRALLLTPPPTDLADANGTVLKRGKGSALLQRFVQQGSQNDLNERKAVWKVLDRTLTELKFTEALPGLSKDTAPGPDKVKYSDIKSLSVDDKSDLFTLYEKNFPTGRVPQDWSHSYLKPIPKSDKDHSKSTDTVHSQYRTPQEG